MLDKNKQTNKFPDSFFFFAANIPQCKRQNKKIYSESRNYYVKQHYYCIKNKMMMMIRWLCCSSLCLLLLFFALIYLLLCLAKENVWSKNKQFNIVTVFFFLLLQTCVCVCVRERVPSKTKDSKQNTEKILF